MPPVLDSDGMATCIVSLLDTEGVRHTVELEAESLYEAGALAVRAFKKQDCEPVGMNELEIEVRTSIVHSLPVWKLHDWLNGGAKSPREAVTKDRLRALLLDKV